MKQRVVVTGLGAASCFGLGVDAFFSGLLSGAQAMRVYSSLTERGLGALPLALVPLPEDKAASGTALFNGSPRAVQFAECAAEEALFDAGWQKGKARLGLCVGTTLGEKAPWIAALRDGIAAPKDRFGCAAPAATLAQRHELGPLRVVSAACASGNAAIGVGLEWIREGRCAAVLCGGVDALQEFVISGFSALRAHSLAPCRPFDAERDGLNLGEGAGFLVLESESHAVARGQRIRAYLDGSGLACDAVHMTGPDREGRGAARAMSAALASGGILAADIDFVSAHGTATPFNDLMEAHALATVFGERSATVPVNSIKGSIGHSLGAAGALEAVMAVRILEEEVVPPTAGHRRLAPDINLSIVAFTPKRMRVRSVLSTSSGFGGLNSAIVLSRNGLGAA